MLDLSAGAPDQRRGTHHTGALLSLHRTRHFPEGFPTLPVRRMPLES